MQEMARRAVLAGAGTLAAGSLAAAWLLRKPAHEVVLASAVAGEPLQPITALRRIVPPRPMPPILFGDGAGRVHGLAEFLGRGVVLNLWATWCAPCVAEMPALAALAARVAARVATDGIVVLPLSIDRQGAAAVRPFYAAHHLTGLGIWTDPDGAAQQALGVGAIPTTFLIDRAGRQVAVLEGPADWSSEAALAAVRAAV